MPRRSRSSADACLSWRLDAARLQDRVVALEAKIAATEQSLVPAQAPAVKAPSKASEKKIRPKASAHEAAVRSSHTEGACDSAQVRRERKTRDLDPRQEASGCELQAPVERSSLQALVAMHKQSQDEIRRLQLALAAHDQRAMAQANKIKACVRGVARFAYRSTSPHEEARPVDPVAVAPSPQAPAGEQAKIDQLEAQHTDSTVQRAETRAATASKREPLTSHSTLRARYAIARAKQQESLYRLRTQQQKQQEKQRRTEQ